ncbi:hypothetical protein IMSAG250_00496 [Clostridiales bacterium]|nr:hypothetical protein IMSAG250_00496 [Clostridiales bacterium]
MAIQINSNIDEELEKAERLLNLYSQIKDIPMDADLTKFILTMEQVGELLHCSARSAAESLKSENAPLVMVGRKPMITATALYDHITNYGLGMKGA